VVSWNRSSSYPLLEVGGAGIDAAATIARQMRWMVAALMTGVQALRTVSAVSEVGSLSAMTSLMLSSA
jgi:hypothetical protein